MNILSFDPGETTGIAVLKSGVFVLGLTVVQSMVDDERLFRSLILMGDPTHVVVEELPTYRMNRTHSENYHRIASWFKTAGYSVDYVNPGQWKGMVKRVEISGTHQMDAATMGLWYYRSRLVNILGK